MTRTVLRKHVVGPLVLTGLLTALSGRGAKADEQPALICPPVSPVSPPAQPGRIVYRPPFLAPRQRTFLISNYAGSVYPPVIPRNDPLTPTTARYNAGRPAGRRFGWLFGGH